MTNEQRAILEKFGFRVVDGLVKHSKLGIVKELEEFRSFSTPEELQESIKQMLRDQCLWKRRNNRA